MKSTNVIFGPAIATVLALTALAFVAVLFGSPFGGFLLTVIAALLYFLPALVADNRRHRERLPIYLLNLFLGWTVLGWVVALVWSVTSHVEPNPAEAAEREFEEWDKRHPPLPPVEPEQTQQSFVGVNPLSTSAPPRVTPTGKSISPGQMIAIAVGLLIFILLVIVAAISSGPSQSPEILMLKAESSVRSEQFSAAAELFNQIVSRYPKTHQARTVVKICSILRDKDISKEGPFTADEAQRLGRLIDSFDKIKRGYLRATPQTRRDLETVFGAEMFRQNDDGLDALSSSARNLQDSMNSARQGQ